MTMTGTLFHHVRWQFGVTALLLAGCAVLGGKWLASPVFSSQVPRVAMLREIPRQPPSQESAAAQIHEASEQERSLRELLTQFRQKKARRQEEQNKLASAKPAMSSPSRTELDRLLARQPDWASVVEPSTNVPHLVLIWNATAPADTDVKTATDILEKSSELWIKKAGDHAGLLAERRKSLNDLRSVLKSRQESHLASLTPKRNEKDVKNFLAAIASLFAGSLRATPGENFTNSAGIELVWVADGGFWIGRTEVTGRQYNLVVSPETPGGDEPKDGVSISAASLFISRLQEMEADDSFMPPETSQHLRPADFAYALPSVSQWIKARSLGESLNLLGLLTEPHEWTSNQHADGPYRTFKQSPIFPKRVGSDFPVAMDDGAPITLEPRTTSSVTVAGTSKTGVLWSGRLGFRVILLPKN